MYDENAFKDSDAEDDEDLEKELKAKEEEPVKEEVNKKLFKHEDVLDIEEAQDRD